MLHDLSVSIPLRKSERRRSAASLVTTSLCLMLLPCIAGGASAPQHHSSQNISALPLPAGDKQQSLIYRSASKPIGDHNGVAFWLMGNGMPGAISIYLLASRGAASAPPPIQGSGEDNEPLWPAWISKPISTNFSGWHRVLIPASDLTYRPGAGTPPGAAPAPLQSADAFGIASANTDGILYIDDIVWANIDASGNAAGGSASIDDFASGDLAQWRIKGSPEAVSRLIPGITASAQYVKEDHVSLKLDYSRAAVGRVVLANTVLAAMGATGKDYLVSVPTTPFEKIFPDTLPLSQEISTRVVLTECPEQTGCGSFALFSLHGMNNVSVHLSSDLIAIGKSIPRSNVNISVVKVWDRQGSSVLIDPDSSGPTPELLMKDDRIPLSMAGGQAPKARTTGDPVTDIPAGTEKQFWVDITVPRNTPPGRYTCQMLVTAQHKAPFSISLETDVLPLRLLSPSKQYVINYRGKQGSAGEADGVTDHVTSDQLSSDMADISAHGFHYITLTDTPDELPQTLTAEASFNFQAPIIYPLSSGPEGLATAKSVDKLSSPTTNYCYLSPDGSTLSTDLANLKKAGLQTAAVINSDADYAAEQNNLDVAIYPVQEAYVQRLLKSAGKRESNTRDWLTWPSAQSDPQTDRLYSGYLLWRTDLYGAYISDYQTCYSTDPYDDTIAPADSTHAAYRPAMLTYPTEDGVIDTVQWESVREGINDVRYLTTFFAALRECKDAKVDLVQVNKAETDVASFMNSSFWLMSDAGYQKGRTMITNYALQLRKAVDTYNAHLKRASNVKQPIVEPHTTRRSG